jgi:hypothetical protein
MLEESLFNYLQNHTNAASLPKSQLDIAMQILEDLNIITVEDLFNYSKWDEIDVPTFFGCILCQISGVQFNKEAFQPTDDGAAQSIVEEERMNIFDRFWESIGHRLSEKLSIVANRCGHTCLSRELIVLCGNAQSESVVEQKLKQFVTEKLQAMITSAESGGELGVGKPNSDFLSPTTPKIPSLNKLKYTPSITPQITAPKPLNSSDSNTKSDSLVASDDATNTSTSTSTVPIPEDIDTRPTLYTTTPTTTATTTFTIENDSGSTLLVSTNHPNNTNSPFTSPNKRHSRLEFEADSLIAKVKQIFSAEIIDFEVSDQICGIIDEVKQYYEIPEVNARVWLL